MDEIKADIQTAREIADEIKALSYKLGHNGGVDDAVVSAIFGQSEYSDSYRSVAAWMYYKTGACFLQDADNMIMKTDDLVEALTFLKEKFPEITPHHHLFQVADHRKKVGGIPDSHPKSRA